jgi:hypothetical protein
MDEDLEAAQRSIEAAIDILALGYPYGGTQDVKSAFMAELARAFEDRAEAVRAIFDSIKP